MSVKRPILRYHGGKWMLAPWIISHMPSHRIYVEPFGGVASVLLRKPRSYAEVYNDLDAEVVNLFRILRSPILASELERQVRLTPWSRNEFFRTYEASSDPIERARKMVCRGFMAFGTTSRRKNVTGFRSKAYRQSQSGVADWLNYPAAIQQFVERLQGVCIEEQDANSVIRQQDSIETLFYCDPPYVQSTRSSIRTPSQNDRAYAVDLTDTDHRSLAEILHRVKGLVMLSGYRCDLYDELYSDWLRVDRSTYADGAKKRTESLWLNPASVRLRPQGSVFDPQEVA